MSCASPLCLESRHAPVPAFSAYMHAVATARATNGPLPNPCSAVVGEIDDELNRSIDLGSIRAAPLKPLAH